MNSKLTATVPTGLTARVIPLAPLHDLAARLELPSGTRELTGEGANYGVLETTYSTVSLKLGPASVTQQPAYHNGTKPNPDLRLLRALAVEAVPLSVPAEWPGDPAAACTLGCLADAGKPGTVQSAAAALVRSWTPDEVLTIGGFTGGPSAGALDAGLAAFAPERTAGHLWPVMGAPEWDTADILTLLDARFPHVSAFPGTSCYDKLITDEGGEPFAHLLFLDGGRKSDGTAAGLTGGAGPGSSQWQWMEGRVAACHGARWRIACIYWPMVTGVTGVTGVTVLPELVALARSGHFDLILCGHTHSNEELTVHGVPVLNISTASQSVRPAGDTLQGALGDAAAVWTDSTRQCVTRLHLTPQSLTWEIFDLATAAPVRTRSIPPRAPQPCGAFLLHLQDGVSGISQDVKLRFEIRAGDSVLLKWPQGLPFTGNAAVLQIAGSPAAPLARQTLVRAIAIGF